MKHLILPPGTQVVTRVAVKPKGGGELRPAGTVGVVFEAPTDGTHAYCIQLVDGSEAILQRVELSILKEFKSGELITHEMGDGDWPSFIIYRCVVGSRAFGLSEVESDVDRRGIYVPPAELEWSLYGVPEQLEDPAQQECYWELQKFLVMALKANPNVLECLYTPLVEMATPLTERLLAMRDAFLSRLVYQTYNGYVLSQFKKIEQDLRAHGAIKWKHAMHLIRLLLAGVGVLREGRLQLDVGEHRDALLRIKRGEVPWPEVNEWRLRLHAEFDAAFARTTLPLRPDYERANALLLEARRQSTRRWVPRAVVTSACLPDGVTSRLRAVVANQPHPLVFVTISGAHLYGFPSSDSDYDLRGAHVLPARQVLGLKSPRETIEVARVDDGLDLDLVTHDVKKFFTLLLTKNGYVLEQLYSPLVIHATPEHAELKEIAKGCITRHHSHHYLGFAETQWKLFEKQPSHPVKPLLYVYRVLLTGIHLMRSGEVEANLERLSEEFALPHVTDLIAVKRAGTEHADLRDADIARHRREVDTLRADLEAASRSSTLPDAPSALSALDDLLCRLRESNLSS